MLEQRQQVRAGMIRPARLLFGGTGPGGKGLGNTGLDNTGLDCALLDLSTDGARVSLLAAADVPDLVTLRLPDGAARAARRRWQRNAEIGFEFLSIDPSRRRVPPWGYQP